MTLATLLNLGRSPLALVVPEDLVNVCASQSRTSAGTASGPTSLSTSSSSNSLLVAQGCKDVHQHADHTVNRMNIESMARLHDFTRKLGHSPLLQKLPMSQQRYVLCQCCDPVFRKRNRKGDEEKLYYNIGAHGKVEWVKWGWRERNGGRL